MFADERKRPAVLGWSNLLAALALHFLAFVGFWTYAHYHPQTNEVVTPIDLTVVVVENLDGNEDEPPPLKKPEPPPPPPPKPKVEPPKPKPKEPEKPKALEQIVTNIVTRVEKKPDKPAPKKEPEKPKKTAKELREERLKKMRESATKTVKAPTRPQPNGRTDKKTLSDKEIDRYLNAGYKPGRSNNLAANEEQLCISLIKRAFEDKWDKPAWTDTLRPMVIRVWFGAGGRILRTRLESSSGDAAADQSIKSAAGRVGSVAGLTAAFLEKNRSNGVPIRFTVTPE